MLRIVYPICCGMDVHRDFLVACIAATNEQGVTTYKSKRFSTNTGDLRRCAFWLKDNNCKDVCMESTGKYWIPIYNILESSCNIVLAHPKYVKAIRGKKTDKKDAKWIADIFKHDLVAGSFIPPADIRQLRDLVRYRWKLTNFTTGEKEGSVVSDSKVSAELVYRLAPLWKTAPVITFASQTADGQLTVAWDHEDYDTGVEYAVMKINKVLGIATGEERLGSTKGHEFVVRDLNNGGYCINIVPTLKGEKGSYSADANIEIKNEWVLAPTLSCEQLNGNQVRLTWKAPGNIEKYHITVYRGDNASLLRFVDLDFGKYAEFDVEAAEGDMEYIYTYDEPTDPENGIRLKFEIYGARRTTSGGEQHSAVSGKTIIIK